MKRSTLRAPFPWFGGKSRVADLVWAHFGDVPNYVEPFFGSGAVLLARPFPPRIETINDKDAYVANFWRAVQADPDAVAEHADHPVNEADLHAWHLWLVTTGKERIERTKTDPHFYDVEVAGRWVWGICMWIGGGWCRGLKEGSWGQRPNLGDSMGLISERRPHLSGHSVGVGVHSNLPKFEGDGGRKRPSLAQGAKGVLAAGVEQRRPTLRYASGISDPQETPYRRQPNVYRGTGRGVLSSPNTRPELRHAGQGIHAQLPDLNGRADRRAGLVEWMQDLAARLRRVRVCCGDWKRVTGPTPTYLIGLTGVFLDPPYSEDERDEEIYATETAGVADEAREWAIANGDNPKLRIALCGYQGEHDMPESWRAVPWKSPGGYAMQAKKGNKSRGKTNAGRECVWFSPHCLRPDLAAYKAAVRQHELPLGEAV